jgi:threonine/homoserine/homoserine lactone efflux protein
MTALCVVGVVWLAWLGWLWLDQQSFSNKGNHFANTTKAIQTTTVATTR